MKYSTPRLNFEIVATPHHSSYEFRWPFRFSFDFDGEYDDIVVHTANYRNNYIGEFHSFGHEIMRIDDYLSFFYYISVIRDGREIYKTGVYDSNDVYKETCQTVTKLPAPQNVRIVGNVLIWDGQPNRNYYVFNSFRRESGLSSGYYVVENGSSLDLDKTNFWPNRNQYSYLTIDLYQAEKDECGMSHFARLRII